MARVSVLNKIPAAIRHELIDRKNDRPGLTLDDHAEWLAEQGYKASRSAIHRYFAMLGEDPLDEGDTEALPAEWAVRLGCLMVASKYSTPGDKEGLLSLATELSDWVTESPTE